jgi:hypothetical protein
LAVSAYGVHDFFVGSPAGFVVPDGRRPGCEPATTTTRRNAMTELLLGVTVVFVVYVLYEVFKTVSQSDAGQTRVSESAPVTTEQAAPAQPAAEESAPSAEEAEKTIVLHNPATGETSPVPTNYRFAKKWIKEALVVEGLLKKVYKNSELTESVSAQVKEALEKFKHIEKYHA